MASRSDEVFLRRLYDSFADIVAEDRKPAFTELNENLIALLSAGAEDDTSAVFGTIKRSLRETKNRVFFRLPEQHQRGYWATTS